MSFLISNFAYICRRSYDANRHFEGRMLVISPAYNLGKCTIINYSDDSNYEHDTWGGRSGTDSLSDSLNFIVSYYRSGSRLEFSVGGISHLYRRGLDICLFCHFEDKSIDPTAKTGPSKGGRQQKYHSASVDDKKGSRLAGSNSIETFTEVIQMDWYSSPWNYPPPHFLVWHNGNVVSLVSSSNFGF